YAGSLEQRIGPAFERDIISIALGATTLEFTWNSDTPTAPSLHYIHTDRLGSPELTLDGNGNSVDRVSFDAWGNALTSDLTAPSPRRDTSLSFTGHHDDLAAETGDGFEFVDMQGRIYNPLLKHFWSPDPLVQSASYGPTWNRFSYALNNPVKFV